MFKQDRTNPSTAVSNWKGRTHTPKAWPSTAISTWLNGGLFSAGGAVPAGPKGYTGAGTGLTTTFDRIVFATDVFTNVEFDSNAWGSSGGISDNSVAGYVSAYPYYGGAGGTSGYIRKWTYATETGSSESATLATPHDGGCNFSDADRGFWSKGYTPSGTRLSAVEKFTYGTATISAATSLGSGSNDLLGFSASTIGYSFCGYTNFGNSSAVYATAYSTGAYTTKTSPPAAASSGTTTSNVGTAAYINCYTTGGTTLAYTSLWKCTYSSDSYSVLTSMLTTGFPHSGNRGTLNDGSTSGFICGNNYTTVAKINFSSDTSSNLSTGLSSAARQGSALTEGYL